MISLPNGNVCRRYFELFSGGCEYNVDSLLTLTVWATRSSPYREVNDEHEQIFVHVPRTGGTSIAEALFQKSVGGHTPLYAYRIFDPQRYDQYFKFAFVRNPYSRLVSAFHQVKHNANNPRTQRWSETYLGSVESFREFIKRLENDRAFRSTVTSMDHFRPQWEFITVNGNIGVDYLGKFEKIESDFGKVSNHLGIKCELPHKNKSSHNQYIKYYQGVNAGVVRHIYKKDFANLGYDLYLD